MFGLQAELHVRDVDQTAREESGRDEQQRGEGNLATLVVARDAMRAATRAARTSAAELAGGRRATPFRVRS